MTLIYTFRIIPPHRQQATIYQCGVIIMLWSFIQSQVLGMKWLSDTVNDLLVSMGLDVNSAAVGSVHFFIYDTVKISILLCVLIFCVSYIQTFFPPERSKRIMGRFRGLKANIIGALLGAVTPFCSCSSIPIFMGFTSAGLPLGMTFSFLISSPMINPGSLVLLMSIFGTLQFWAGHSSRPFTWRSI